MAFTLTEAQQIRTFLGYSDTKVDANTWLTATIGQVGAESETAIRALIVEITGIDTQLGTARTKRMQVSEVDGIKLLGPEENRMLRKDAARLCNRIGVILGIKVVEDIYANGGGSGSSESGLMPFGN
jgi:hypothetical protein